MSARIVRDTLRDSLLLAVVGFILALLANAVSPRGLSLQRDYFPAAPVGAPVSAHLSASLTIGTGRHARLVQNGIRHVTHARAVELFQDPSSASGRIIFIDARAEASFRAGRIRGAYRLDHYRLDQSIAEILGACAIAEHIVVYCNGGECEDSELVAIDLLAFGVPAQKLAVYSGGIAEWQAHGMPVESGPSGSGRHLPP